MATDDPILVWGGGAIGGTLAAWWARAGLPVTLVDIDAAHVAACRSGLRVQGPVDAFTVPVAAATPDTLRGQYRRIVLAVKAQHTESALDALTPHLAEDGFVLSAQNGLNEHRIAARIGADRTIGCFVNFGADWQAPGEILLGNRGAVVVGELDGLVRERTLALHQALRVYEPEAVLTDNIWGYLWGKLAYGAMLFATALTTDSMTTNFADADRTRVFEAVAREVMKVASAEGVTPIGFNGFDPTAFMADASPAAARASIAALAEFNRHTAKTHSGIYRDLAVRRRRTEVDAQIGDVVTRARAAGIQTPALARLVELIHDIEDGRRAQSTATFHALAAAC